MKKISALIVFSLAATTAQAYSVTVVGSILQAPASKIAGSTASTASNTGSIAKDAAGMNRTIQMNFGGGAGYVNGQLDRLAGQNGALIDLMAQLSDLESDNLFKAAKADKAEQINREESIGVNAIDVCRTATSARRTGQGKSQAELAKATINEASIVRGTSTITTGASANNIIRSHERYCSSTDYALSLCESPSKLQNADIKSSTLFDGAAEITTQIDVVRDDQGNVIGTTGRPSVSDEKAVAKRTFNIDDINASTALINNAVNPFPDEAVTIAANGGDRKLIPEYQSKYLARQSRIDFANSALTDIQSQRVPVVDLGGWKETIAGESGDISDLEEKAVDGKISLSDKLAFEVSRRHDNPEWHVSMAEKTSGQKQNEMLQLLALIARIEHRQLEVMERTSATQGVHLAHVLSPITKADLEESNPDTDY